MPLFTQQFSAIVPPVATTVNGVTSDTSTIIVEDSVGTPVGTLTPATGVVVIPDAAVTMAWVTEYDWTPASDGTVSLTPLNGSTYSGGGVAWDIYADELVANFGIHATDGLGVSGQAGNSDEVGVLTADIADLIAAGGGPVYDPHTDAIEIWVEYGSLSFETPWAWTYVNITHHSGGYRYDGIGRPTNSGNVLRRGVVDDNVSPAAIVDADDAVFGSTGVFAWRMVGTEIGCGYSVDAGMGDDFDALTENVSGNKYLGIAVRQGAGNSDAAVPTLQLVFITQAIYLTTQRIKRIRVRRWRGVIV